MNILNASRSLGASIAAALLTAAAFAPATDAQTWIRDIDSTSLRPRGLAVRDDGLIAVARDGASGGGVTFFDADGVLRESYDFAAFDGSETVVNDAVFLDDGSLVVCGSSDAYPWVAAVDVETGIPLWNTVMTRGDDHGVFESLAVNELGHVVLHGTLIGLFDISPFVAAVRPEVNGATVYRRLFGTQVISSLATAANGDLIFGSSSGSVSITRTSNFANIKWRKTYAEAFSDAIPRFVETSTGDLMSIGLVRNASSDYDFVAMKMTADGNFIWRRAYETFPTSLFGVVNEVTAAVATDDGGLVAAVGQPVPGDGTRDAALLRLDADGNVVWLRPMGKPGVNDIAVDLERTPDGGFVVAVQVQGGGLRVVRVDANGEAGNCAIGPMLVTDLPVGDVTTTEVSFDYTNYGKLWGDATISPFTTSALVTNVCGEPCSVTGGTYGAGTVGSAGLSPKLAATDGSCLGYTPRLEVSDAIGGAAGLVFIGFAAGSTPALGGTFLIDPSNFLSFPVVLGGPAGVPGAGEASFPMGTDLTPFAGITLHLQALFSDPNGPANKTLTNGVTFTIQ